MNGMFNSLIFVRDDGFAVYKSGKKLKSVFRCSCGKTKSIVKSMVVNGRTKSCGCLQIAAIKKQGLANKKPPGEAALTCVLTSYRAAAKRRNLEFKLTRDQFRHLAKQPCCYCGAEPCNSLGKNKLNGDFVYNGIDRVNNAKGYTLDNTVPCCRLCNWAKGTLAPAEFEAWIVRLYHRLCSIKAAVHQLGKNSG